MGITTSCDATQIQRKSENRFEIDRSGHRMFFVFEIFQFDFLQKCHEYRNYSAVMAIMSGLQAISVHRLTHTWNVRVQRNSSKSYISQIVLAKEKTKAMFETLQNFVSREGNFPNLRSAHMKGQSPMIPYLGIILQDMLFVDEGNKNFDANGYINFQKRRRWYSMFFFFFFQKPGLLFRKFRKIKFYFGFSKKIKDFRCFQTEIGDFWIFFGVFF